MVVQLVEGTICPVMQRMLSLFVALAVLIVPLGMISGSAAAHASPVHATMTAGGCHEGSPAPENKSKGVGMTAECALACAALPAMPARIAVPLVAPPVVYPIVALHGLANAGPDSLDPPPRV